MADRRRINSGSPFEASIGFSRAVRAGNRVVVSGTAPVWPDGSCPADAGTQARRCLEIILAALTEAGAGPADVVRTRMYIVSPEDATEVGAAACRSVRVGTAGRHHGRGGRPPGSALAGGD